ncbi:MAG TPA: APC family permease [Xanthomonadales bacterium]|nr:APC family permease [Xanthomonadales bacterium]
MNDTNKLHGDAALIKAVGFIALTAAVINITIGSGIFKMPGALATALGASAPWAFVAGAVAIVPIALCFAAAGSRVAATGGPYTYVGSAFGEFPGFVAGSLMWICNIASSAAVSSALCDQLAAAMPELGSTSARAGLLLAIYALLITLNAFGVKLGARAIIVLATIKLTPLILFAAVGAFFVDWSSAAPVTWPGLTAFGPTLVLVMFAYSGMETALIPSGEVKDPSKQVPRATLTAIALVVAIYVGVQLVAQGAMGADLAGQKAPVAAAAGTLWKPGFALLLATAMLSMLGFLQGNMLASARVPYALARDGLLPAALARITEKHRVPLVAVFAHGLLALALALSSLAGGAAAEAFEAFAIISGGANCMVYVGVCVAAWWLQRRGIAAHGTPFSLPGGPLVPAVSLALMGYVLWQLKVDEWIAIGIALAVLVALYFIVRWRRA